MSEVKPTVFISHSHVAADARVAERLTADLQLAGITVWKATADLATGDSLPAILDRISACDLFLAYVTDNYLKSPWCSDEVQRAQDSQGVEFALYADTKETVDQLPGALRAQRLCKVLDESSTLEAAGKAHRALQTRRTLVPSIDHVFASPTVLKDEKLSMERILTDTEDELVLAGPNLRAWLMRPEIRARMIEFVQNGRKLTLILATYRTLGAISHEGAHHLWSSVEELLEIREQLTDAEQKNFKVCFHPGAATLSAVFISPRKATGLMQLSPRWGFQAIPHDRLTLLVDKGVTDHAIFNSIWNAIDLMILSDARTLDQMKARWNPDDYPLPV